MSKRHAKYYLSALFDVQEAYLKGHPSITSALALFDSEWSQIQQEQRWAAANADTYKSATVLCSQYAGVGASL